MLLHQIDCLLRTIHVFGIAMFKPTPIKYFVVLYISHKYSFLISYAICLMTISLHACCIMYSTLFPSPYARYSMQATLYFSIPIAPYACSVLFPPHLDYCCPTVIVLRTLSLIYFISIFLCSVFQYWSPHFIVPLLLANSHCSIPTTLFPSPIFITQIHCLVPVAQRLIKSLANARCFRSCKI